MFKANTYRFQWKDLGDIQEGRPNLGGQTSVAVYRLMQYTMRDVLIAKYDVEQANEILIRAGKLAGTEFCKNMLDTNLEFGEFVASLQEKLKTLGVGILRIEEADMDKMQFVLTVSEDLDCSGLPITGETVCEYDEGFIEGILETYTKRRFTVKEVDCWATGDRTCRFSAKLKESE